MANGSNGSSGSNEPCMIYDIDKDKMTNKCLLYTKKSNMDNKNKIENRGLKV